MATPSRSLESVDEFTPPFSKGGLGGIFKGENWTFSEFANRVFLVLMVLAACLALFGCSETDRQQLVLTGSSTVAPLAMEIANRFERQNPGVRVDVQTGGSSRGINDVRSGLADIGMVSRALKPDEADLTAHTIAWDGITVILNTANPIANLVLRFINDV